MSIAARALHGVNVCVIPSPYNDDRPLLLRPRPLAAISAVLVGIKALAILTVLLTPSAAELSTITNDRIVQLTNTERTKAGLPALTKNSALAAAAKDKGNHMLEQDYFAHISPSGVTPWFWIQKHNYVYVVAGENLAIDFVEAEDVVAAWMASPTHKANILHTDYTETGVAAVTGEFQGRTATIIVHMFGKPVTSTVVSEPTPVPTTAGTQETPPTPTPTPESTPAPTAEPTATPVPTVPVPRIAIIGSTTVKESVSLAITGTPGTTVTILANGEVHTTVPMTDTGVNADIDISELPDGSVVLRAYATSENGQSSSQISNSVAFVKDTQGPSVDLAELPFVINPQFDAATAVTLLPIGDSERIAFINARSPQAVEAEDEFGNRTNLENVFLQPTFQSEARDTNFQAPQRMVRLSRQISVTTLVILLTLLSAAVLVRVRFQHPRLITHASLVVVLAAALFVI